MRELDHLRGLSAKEALETPKFDAQKRLDYYNILNRRYGALRKAKFSENRIIDNDFGAFSEKTSKGIWVENTEGDEEASWNYRKPISIRHKIMDYKIFPKERVSLNCVADKKLITVLDKYFAQGIVEVDGKEILRRPAPVVGYYKTPREGDVASWLQRSDPVTLYFMDKIDLNTLREIKTITEPFKNKEPVSESDLVFAEGQVKGASWMSYLAENQPEDECVLMKKVKKTNPEMAHAIYGFLKAIGKTVLDEKGKLIKTDKDDMYSTLFRCSAGQHFVINEMVTEYLKSISKVKTNFTVKNRSSVEL